MLRSLYARTHRAVPGEAAILARCHTHLWRKGQCARLCPPPSWGRSSRTLAAGIAGTTRPCLTQKRREYVVSLLEMQSQSLSTGQRRTTKTRKALGMSFQKICRRRHRRRDAPQVLPKNKHCVRRIKKKMALLVLQRAALRPRRRQLSSVVKGAVRGSHCTQSYDFARA